MLPLGQIVEVYSINPIYDLPYQPPGFHVVIGFFEDTAHNSGTVAIFTDGGQLLQFRKEPVIDKFKQTIAG